MRRKGREPFKELSLPKLKRHESWAFDFVISSIFFPSSNTHKFIVNCSFQAVVHFERRLPSTCQEYPGSKQESRPQSKLPVLLQQRLLKVFLVFKVFFSCFHLQISIGWWTTRLWNTSTNTTHMRRRSRSSLAEGLPKFSIRMKNEWNLCKFEGLGIINLWNINVKWKEYFELAVWNSTKAKNFWVLFPPLF